MMRGQFDSDSGLMRKTEQLTNEELLFGGGLVQDELKAIDAILKTLNQSFRSIQKSIAEQGERRKLLNGRLESVWKEIQARQQDGRMPQPPKVEVESLWGDWLEKLVKKTDA